MPTDIGPRIGIDGEAEFRKELRNINNQLKTLGTEMKTVTSAFEGNEKSVEALAAQNTVLAREIGTQEQALARLRQGLIQSTAKYGELDDKTLKWQQAVNNATTNLYSSDSRDLGNMPLDLYMQKVEKVMELIFKATRPGGYNAWVVKDYRDTKHGVPYIDLHSKIAQAGEKAGFLYHDLIIWDQNAHRKLVLLGYPSVFYVNQNHSYIVIMRKPR